jgi:TetR/AcrR family transcriptional repressor of mexCD-oprJ operon
MRWRPPWSAIHAAPSANSRAGGHQPRDPVPVCAYPEAIDEALFAAGFERVEAAAAWFDQGGDARHVLEQVTATLLADWELVTLLFARMMEEQQRLGDLHLLPERWAPIGERFEAFFLRGQAAGEFNVGFTAVWLADFYWSCFYGITWSLARGRLAPAAAASTLLASFQRGAMMG